MHSLKPETNGWSRYQDKDSWSQKQPSGYVKHWPSGSERRFLKQLVPQLHASACMMGIFKRYMYQRSDSEIACHESGGVHFRHIDASLK